MAARKQKLRKLHGYNKIFKLPDYEVHLSSLDIFLVNSNPNLTMISDEFFKRMKEVKVLDMKWCQNAQLPQSLKLLTKLRVLNLEENKSFHDMSLLAEMKELEILILNETGIKEIPKEIGRLVNLRRLEVCKCRYVTPGVISKLRSLEELSIDLMPMSEGVKGCTAEVMKLSKLTYLDLKVKSFDLIHEDFNSENLKGFVIQIGDFFRGNELPYKRSDRYLIISSEHLVIPLLKWSKKLIEVSRPRIYLSRIENLNNMMPTLYNEGFNKLEHIWLYNCCNVSCLVHDGRRCDKDEEKTKKKFFSEVKTLRLWYLDNLEVLWKCPDEYISLTNLVTFRIRGCDKLERLFTVSVAQGLVNLKELDIDGCDGLEEVICSGGGGIKDDESGNVIVFPSLTTISLYGLRRLKRFFNSVGNYAFEYPALVEVEIQFCESMEIWGPVIHKTPNLKALVGNYGGPIVMDGPLAINETVEKVMKKVTEKVGNDDDE